MFTPYHDDIESDNLRITDDLDGIRVSMEREGRPSLAEVLENAIRYIAHLRGRVNTIDLTPLSIIAPVGIDGLICSEWLAEQVERRMESLRDESIDARQRFDRAADALNDFANAIRQAAR
jgi:cell division protein ZapA (FtsZ GTPase activity inhibitor)